MDQWDGFFLFYSDFTLLSTQTIAGPWNVGRGMTVVLRDMDVFRVNPPDCKR